MARLGLEHRMHFTEVYLRPALEAGWIEMTIPTSPAAGVKGIDGSGQGPPGEFGRPRHHPRMSPRKPRRS